jgi:hypothetical protein
VVREILSDLSTRGSQHNIKMHVEEMDYEDVNRQHVADSGHAAGSCFYRHGDEPKIPSKQAIS